MNIRQLLQTKVRQAMTAAGIAQSFDAHVALSKNPKFGDYQANGAMAAAKAMKTNPRELAQNILSHLTLEDIASHVEIAGPGFINIHLNPNWLARQLTQTSQSPRLGVEKKEKKQRVVLDYSSPNLAKEMHVGHLRSTIIGDAIARILEFSGDEVIRQNHVGDWGTQFGMLIAELEDQLDQGDSAELALHDLEKFYQSAKKRFDEDETFAIRAREYVVKLQSGDANVLALWEEFKQTSLAHSEEIYAQLNVTLTAEHVRGESAYNNDLSILVDALKQQGLARTDEGALVVFLEELADKKGKPSPVIIQKKDGGYLYATTDLAALRYRQDTLKADRVQYFIDDRQSLHMKQVFTLAKKAKFVAEDVQLEHRAFGKMLGKDGKPFKTRSGGTVKLANLLSDAIDKAAESVQKRSTELDEAAIKEISQKVGIGAVKYADLSKTRTNDYIFDLDAMISFEGNTGPYIQYAYTRIVSIFRNAGLTIDTFNGEALLASAQEKELALKLLRFSEIIDQLVDEAYPHVLCTYLYELASDFMGFYEAFPILKKDVDAVTKNSRLQLSKATASTLKLGLELLGIQVMERM